MQSDPYKLDSQALRRAYDRAAPVYANEAVLQASIGQQLFQRLELTTLEPQRIIDLGCAVGANSVLLRSRFPDAQLVGVDFSLAMLRQARHRCQDGTHWLLLDFFALPFPDNSVDLIFSNLALHRVNDLDAVLAELFRVLKPEGLLTFSSFGPDSLMELRWAWGEVDQYVHIHRFLDMHDVGDGLIRAGFSEPVMDVDRLTLTYDGGRSAMKDLRNIGESNSALGRQKGLTGKSKWNRVLNACERLKVDNRFPSTFELVFGQAWGRSDINQTKYQGEVHIPISSFGRR